MGVYTSSITDVRVGLDAHAKESCSTLVQPDLSLTNRQNVGWTDLAALPIRAFCSFCMFIIVTGLKTH